MKARLFPAWPTCFAVSCGTRFPSTIPVRKRGKCSVTPGAAWSFQAALKMYGLSWGRAVALGKGDRGLLGRLPERKWGVPGWDKLPYQDGAIPQASGPESSVRTKAVPTRSPAAML